MWSSLTGSVDIDYCCYSRQPSLPAEEATIDNNGEKEQPAANLDGGTGETYRAASKGNQANFDPRFSSSATNTKQGIDTDETEDGDENQATQQPNQDLRRSARKRRPRTRLH